MNILSTRNLTMEVTGITEENALSKLSELSQILGPRATGGTWKLMDGSSDYLGDDNPAHAYGGVHNWAAVLEQVGTLEEPVLVVTLDNLPEDEYDAIMERASND